MERVKEIFEELKTVTSSALGERVESALQEAHVAIINRAVIGDHQRPDIHPNIADTVNRFEKLYQANFDELTGDVQREVNVLDYSALSLVEEDDLEAIIAMEGMISHARNCDIEEYLKFNTRLDTLFFGTRIDESNNPMDPEQIGEAFKEAVRPLQLPSVDLLITYRNFNSHVFHELEQVLAEANDVLIGFDVLPDLDMAARSREIQKNKRSKRREKSDPRDRAFSNPEQQDASGASNQQIFSMLQSLMRGTPNQGGSAEVTPAGLEQGMMVGKQQVEMLKPSQLQEYLDQIESNQGGEQTSAVAGPVDLSQSLGKLLERVSDDNTLRAVDSGTNDVINLVNLLFDAIWDDHTLPIPIKELIGRTQITVLKLALNEPKFFDEESHPARVLLNELATAGIGWIQPEKLESDPMYTKMKELVEQFTEGYQGDLNFVKQLVQDFLEFKKEQLMSVQKTEEGLKDADERANRLEEINSYAHEKIMERILDEQIDPVVVDFLESYFQKFIVQVILREGPGGISWKPVMNTIDVLLWTVQPGKSREDLNRFVRVSPRLKVNLSKALEVAEIDKAEAEVALKKIQQVQESCFQQTAEAQPDSESEFDSQGTENKEEKGLASDRSRQPEADSEVGEEYLKEVENYPIGIWLEFQAEGQQTIRGTLAAKIETIDKYVFVNASGVKVVEESRRSLARELQAGTVKVISEAPLIDRALESIIGTLRDQSNSNDE